MLCDYIINYLKEFIDADIEHTSFNYKLNNKSSLETYTHELHKFNKLYNSYFFSKNRLLYVINSYEIVLEKKELEHIVKIYTFFKKYKSNNCFLIAEFLLSYFNSINTLEYQKNVKNYKEIRKNFIRTLSTESDFNKILEEIMYKSYELYCKIIDYGVKQENFFLGEIMERGCVNLIRNKQLKKMYIKKLLNYHIYPSRVIIYDENIKDNIKYYEEYLLNLEKENSFSKNPDEILYKLDKEKLLKRKVFNSVLNKIIDQVNILHDQTFDKQNSFLQIITEADELIKLLNEYLTKIKNMDSTQKRKIHECLVNILYLKRFVVSDEKRMYSQMHEFKYKKIIPSDKIDDLIAKVKKDISNLYIISCDNFIYELEMALKNYSENPISYIFNSFSIDSDSQVYLKSEDGIEDSIFKQYYDQKGLDYIQKHQNLKNKLYSDYYTQLLKYLSRTFLMKQQFIISIFNNKERNKSLVSILISKGNYKLKNNYIILAKNIVQIEQTIINIMKRKKIPISTKGFKNLNILAKEYVTNDVVFNGLMYINYILYEKHGLNIRDNISHGNYFNKNIDVEIITSLCAIMFLNGLLKEESD